MKRLLAFCLFSGVGLTLCAWAQNTGVAPRLPSSVPAPDASSPEESLGRIFLSGKVVVDDGSVLTGPAEIYTICNGRTHTETFSDGQGNFSFEFDDRVSALTGGQINADSSDDTNRSRAHRDLHQCELEARLSGYSSQAIQLSSRLSGFGTSNVGRVVLHRQAAAEGLTVSATSALAPPAAKKAFEKGSELEKKQKFDEAQQSFEKATQIYPQYAEAWFELGRVQSWRGDNAGARLSFSKAQTADPNYVNPYRALAELAMQEKNWQEVVKVTGRLLERYPAFFPDAWFRNALGNYNLGKFAEAEQSARQGLKLDEAHQIPKMEYLLGLILMQRQDYTEAETHMHQYLQLASKPADVADAQKQLAEIAKLSGAPDAPPRTEKQ